MSLQLLLLYLIIAAVAFGFEYFSRRVRANRRTTWPTPADGPTSNIPKH